MVYICHVEYVTALFGSIYLSVRPFPIKQFDSGTDK